MLPLMRAATSGHVLLHAVASGDGRMAAPSRGHTAFLPPRRVLTPSSAAGFTARLQLPWERSTLGDSSSAGFMTHANHLKRRRTRRRPTTSTAEGVASTSSRWCSSNRWCSTFRNNRNNGRGISGLAVAATDHVHEAAGVFASVANENGASRQPFQTTTSSCQPGLETDSGQPLLTAMEAVGAGVSGGAAAVQGVWCPDEALAGACEAEPRLAAALREFEAKQPGATIIFLAYAGSRLYGTSTATSDVDIKAVYIPARDPAAQRNIANNGDEDGLRLADQRPLPRRKPPAGFDKDFPMESKYWYSSSDSTMRNTVDDIDLELISLDRFFAQLLRAETGGLETLFSMLVPDVTLLADPQMVSLILRDRRWMVSRDITCWVGYTYNHLSRFKKVRRQVMQRATQKAKSNNKRRLHIAKAETAPPAITHSANAGTGSRGSGTPALKTSWAIGSYGSDRPKSFNTVIMKYGVGGGQRPESPVKVATSGSVEAAGTAGREGDRASTDVEEREDVPLLGVLSRTGEEDEDEVEEDGEGWAGAKNARAGKLLSHARRAMIQAEELLKTGGITFPLKRSHVQEIRQLKAMEGAIPRKVQTIKASTVELPNKARSSPLPLRPNREKIKALRAEVLEVHNSRYRQESGER